MVTLRTPTTSFPQYRAFISYSHAADSDIAKALQKGLERFGRSWYQSPNFRVFRDETDLSMSPGLWTSIVEAMNESQFLIFLASPEAVQSHWLHRELDYWLTIRRPDKLLIVLTHGDIFWNDEDGDFDWRRTSALPQR